MLLDSAAHREGAPRWGTLGHAIDALPYVDVEEGDWKPAVEQLLKEEMRRSSKSVGDYLAELPPLPPTRLDAASLVSQEMARIDARTPLPPMDTQRFQLNAPPEIRSNDLNAWKAALNNAQAQLEHQGVRMTNLELLFRYGGNAWKAHLNHVEASASISNKLLNDTKEQIGGINTERKLQQEKIGKQLGSLQDEWLSLVRKNGEISEVCQKLEEEIATLSDGLPAPAGGDAMES